MQINLVGMPAPYTPKNSKHKMFLHKLVHYHVPTQKQIDATLSPLSILKKIKMAAKMAAKILKIDISHDKVNETQYL